MPLRSKVLREVAVDRPKRGARRRYPFPHMRAGWSFFVVPDDDETLAEVDRLIRMALKGYQDNFPENAVPAFEIYVDLQKGQRGIRCTRLESFGGPWVEDVPEFRANWTTRPLPYGRVQPGECFDVRVPIDCPGDLLLGRIRANIRRSHPNAVFRMVRINPRKRHEFIRVFRYV